MSCEKSKYNGEIFRSLAENSPGIIFQVVFHRDTGFRLVYICERVQELLGFTVDQLREDPSRLTDLVPQAEREKIFALFKEGVAECRSFSFEAKVDTREGCRWYQSHVIPYFDDAQTCRFNGVAVDITDQKQKEEQLQKTTNLHQKTLDSIEEAVFVIGPDHRQIVRSCNAQVKTVFGYNPEELMGVTTVSLHLNPYMFRHFAEISEPELDKTGRFETEYQMQRKDGTVIDTYNTVSVLNKKRGWRGGVVSTVRDISLQKRAFHKLKDREEELKKTSAHLEELNTALKVLLERREKDKNDTEAHLSKNINELILPYINRIKKTALNELQVEYINVLESKLREMTKSLDDERINTLLHLSPMETRIANYVKKGYRIKEIAADLHLSPRTVEFHRDNLRKKLGIKGRKINLQAFLSSIS